jgi:hypothetical protein
MKKKLAIIGVTLGLAAGSALAQIIIPVLEIRRTRSTSSGSPKGRTRRWTTITGTGSSCL